MVHTNLTVSFDPTQNSMLCNQFQGSHTDDSILNISQSTLAGHLEDCILYNNTLPYTHSRLEPVCLVARACCIVTKLNSIKNVQRCGDSSTAKASKNNVGMTVQSLGVLSVMKTLSKMNGTLLYRLISLSVFEESFCI